MGVAVSLMKSTLDVVQQGHDTHGSMTGVMMQF